MDLQQLAEADLAHTLEADGQVVTVTDPAGLSNELKALSNDISLLIDPDTGVAVSGRNANVTLRIASLRAAGFVGLPMGIEDGAQLPWIVTYTTVNGDQVTTKVMASSPDRSLGVVSLRLELMK